MFIFSHIQRNWSSDLGHTHCYVCSTCVVVTVDAYMQSYLTLLVVCFRSYLIGHIHFHVYYTGFMVTDDVHIL